MGFCASTESDIDKGLRKEKQKRGVVKLLLLGSGESGKSTIAKQVKLIHLQGFSETEIDGYRSTIHQNIITSMQMLIKAAAEFNLNLSNDSKESTLLLQNMDLDALEDQDVIDAIKYLWSKEPNIRKTWERSNEIQILESAAYYFDCLDRITAADYRPSTEDILRSRTKTTGIIEQVFHLHGYDFVLVDVGGQRSERRKWLHCFQDVTSIIFCVAMSEYDQFLHEDHSMRRTEESMKLFEEICNSKWFGDVSIILFLNKYDLFKEKIEVVDMKCTFPDYDGGCDVKKAKEFLTNKYLSLNHNEQKTIFVHVTTATSTDNIKSVFDDVVSNIIGKHIKDTTTAV